MDARVVFDAIATYKAAWKINPAGKKMALLLQQFSPTQLHSDEDDDRRC